VFEAENRDRSGKTVAEAEQNGRAEEPWSGGKHRGQSDMKAVVVVPNRAKTSWRGILRQRSRTNEVEFYPD
jgi:hypothetical protein